MNVDWEEHIAHRHANGVEHVHEGNETHLHECVHDGNQYHGIDWETGKPVVCHYCTVETTGCPDYQMIIPERFGDEPWDHEHETPPGSGIKSGPVMWSERTGEITVDMMNFLKPGDRGFRSAQEKVHRMRTSR